MAKKKTPRRRTPAPTMAERADRHALYQKAVQWPPADIEFFLQAWGTRRKRAPRLLREDFCGTAHLAAAWVRGNARRRAIGVDLDAPTLAWGKARNLRGAAGDRVELVQANVLDVTRPKADITCALNFSYCVFKTRAELLHYFTTVRRGLVGDGMFVCEIYGGTEAVVELREKREVGDFVYVWEQASFDPITHETLCHIHFSFADGSRMRRAFTYDWRLWTVPELREILHEAGFRRVTPYWEDVDDEGEGTGEYRPAGVEENQESWIVYLVADC